MNLEKLTPEPWEVHDGGRPDHTVCHGGDGCHPLFERWDGNYDTTDAEFVVLARKAFGVMMRRRWEARRTVVGGWFVTAYGNDEPVCSGLMEDDPFTAIVEADRQVVQG